MSVPDPYLWPEDFLDAHRRHWEDAELLLREGRRANADHLYGLSAECGLKAIVVNIIPDIIEGGRLRRQYRRHVDTFWRIYNELMTNARNAQVTGAIYLPDENPFEDWRVDQRYAHRDRFIPDPQRGDFVQRHRAGAERVHNLVLEVFAGDVL